MKEKCKSRPEDFVIPDDIEGPLRSFVKRKNPDFDDKHVERITSNIRGWLGSRYTMLSRVSSDYVNVETLTSFIRDFERSKTKPYGYRRKKS
ncbi:MAG: hypothetical protein HY296_08470 [Thaumarchaeota archaeon]|nr:hypothetical protein [Nitrososphaerota archaeon]